MKLTLATMATTVLIVIGVVCLQASLITSAQITAVAEQPVWLAWIEAYADHLDPTVDSPPSILDHEPPNRYGIW
jgi:hypothetical protein